MSVLPCLAQIPESPAAAVLFYLFAAISVASAIGVVATRNIVRTALCLLFALVGVAGLYFLLHAEFLAAVQLVVYAGGTLILIVFGVMLTSKSPFSRFQPKTIEVVVALIIGAVLLTALVAAIVQTRFADKPPVAGADLEYPVRHLGELLLGQYLLPFELASVLLLVVMIGAAYLAKARRREPEVAKEAALNEAALSQTARKWS